MEKNNIHPEMPPPPSYHQLNPSAPSADNMMPQRMPPPSSGWTSPPQPQQQQQLQFSVQPQPVYVQNVTLQPLGPRSSLITCPSCHQQQMSNIRMESGTKTHLFALLLCVLGCFCCACIPYCTDSCLTTNHYCKHCNAYLGSYDK